MVPAPVSPKAITNLATDGLRATAKHSEAQRRTANEKMGIKIVPGCSAITSHNIQMRWSPPRTIGSEMGTDAETSTRRETPNEPSSKNDRACQTTDAVAATYVGRFMLSVHAVSVTGK